MGWGLTHFSRDIKRASSGCFDFAHKFVDKYLPGPLHWTVNGYIWSVDPRKDTNFTALFLR